MFNTKISFTITPITAIFMVAAFFPWVSFSLNDLDMQPFSFVIGLGYMFFIMKKIRYTSNFALSFAIMFFGLIISLSLSYSVSFLSFRAIYNFLSIYLAYIIFLHIFTRYDTINFIKKINYIWILGGVLELINPSIMEIFGKVRTSLDRGATSFAPEPSFFAANLIFIAILICILSDYKQKENRYLIILNILALIFLARSAIGLSYVLILLVSWLGYHIVSFRPSLFGIKLILWFILGACVLYAVTIFYDDGSRISSLLGKLALEGPLVLFKLDASMNERLAHVVFPIFGMVRDFFIPHGVDTFAEARLAMEPEFDGFFWYSMNTDKIMSWYGDWLFTLGACGVASLALLLWPVFSKCHKNIWTFIAVSIILLSAIPLSYPLIPAIFAALRVRKNRIRSA